MSKVLWKWCQRTKKTQVSYWSDVPFPLLTYLLLYVQLLAFFSRMPASELESFNLDEADKKISLLIEDLAQLLQNLEIFWQYLRVLNWFVSFEKLCIFGTFFSLMDPVIWNLPQHAVLQTANFCLDKENGKEKKREHTLYLVYPYKADFAWQTSLRRFRKSYGNCWD